MRLEDVDTESVPVLVGLLADRAEEAVPGVNVEVPQVLAHAVHPDPCCFTKEALEDAVGQLSHHLLH